MQRESFEDHSVAMHIFLKRFVFILAPVERLDHLRLCHIDNTILLLFYRMRACALPQKRYLDMIGGQSLLIDLKARAGGGEVRATTFVW